MNIQRSNERGVFKNDWLNAHYTFSFGQYYNPKQIGFGPLLVINQDIISAGTGFGQHGHDNMEIITFVTNGRLKHKDTLGSEATIVPGQIQMMSAGTGIRHSEFNDLSNEELRLLQIWIEPNVKNLKPRYQDLKIDQIKNINGLMSLASEKGLRGGLRIDADAELYLLNTENKMDLLFASNRRGQIFIQLIAGELQLNDVNLLAGDSVSLTEQSTIDLKIKANTQALIFDLGTVKR